MPYISFRVSLSWIWTIFPLITKKLFAADWVIPFKLRGFWGPEPPPPSWPDQNWGTQLCPPLCPGWAWCLVFDRGPSLPACGSSCAPVLSCFMRSRLCTDRLHGWLFRLVFMTLVNENSGVRPLNSYTQGNFMYKHNQLSNEWDPEQNKKNWPLN